jgi:hypothetical protein
MRLLPSTSEHQSGISAQICVHPWLKNNAY